MIFFDNAATGAIKPENVYESAITTMKYLSVNAGRASHKLAVYGEELIYKTRKNVAGFFGCSMPSHVIFTKNCTEALNMAIFGTVKKGGNVVISAYEHNSVLRPLFKLEQDGMITLTIVEPENGNILREDIEKAICEKTYMVIVTGASNVTGEISDYEAIGALLKEKGIIFMVDGAQIAGHTFVNMEEDNIDIFCFSGHKGVDALMGVGCLIFGKNIKINPIMFGGSGSETFAKVPSDYPEMLECGTHNLPAIVSLNEAISYTKKIIKEKQQHLLKLTSYLIDQLENFKDVKIYSPKNPVGIVSFSIGDFYTPEVAGVLGDKFDIAVRGGFHCAPLCHKFLKTDSCGLVRVSFSQFNTINEINYFVDCLKRVKEYIY